MILRVIYRDTLLLNLVKISQWILNWLELVHQASFCPSKSSWSPSFTWNLRTSSNWISLLHPPKIHMETQKTSFVFVLCIHVLFNAPGHFAGLCNILAAPPKEKTMFSRYVYSIRVNITDDLSNDIHHQVARYAAPTWNFYAAMHCDLEAHLRHTGKKNTWKLMYFVGLMWWSFNFWKNLHEKSRFFGKKTGWNTEMLRTKFAKTG